MADYVETYREFWREIVEHPDGTLNPDQVMRELYDYRVLLKEIPRVYDEITSGRLSKPNTAARHVIAAVDERIEAAIEQTIRDVHETARDAEVDLTTITADELVALVLRGTVPTAQNGGDRG